MTASSDKTARVWSLGNGALVGKLEGHAGVVYSACFSPDGALVVTASADKTARVWSLADGYWTYDKTARVWSLTDCALVRTLEARALVWSACIY